MKILYVEDNADNIFMLNNRLSRAGYTVVIATDGAQGVVMARSERPDLILMDLSLPVLDGWAATRQIKGAAAAKDIPRVAHVARLRRFRDQADRVAAPVGKDQSVRGQDGIVSGDGPALLVVDDNEDNRYTLTRRLPREGYDNLTTATTGREALDLLQSKSFDLVLLDIMMPDMNGYE